MGIPGQAKVRAIFLDRDGVINHSVIRSGKPYPPDSLTETTIPEDVPSSLQKLKAKGFLLVVVTNQPDVAKGKQRKEVVESINQFLCSKLPIDDIFVCYHTDSDQCDCRKPKPGMLLDAAKKWNIDLAESFMVGDRWRDIEAGINAGCKSLFIDFGYDEKRPTDAHFEGKTLGEVLKKASLID